MQILQSTEYHRFKTISGNRNISDTKVENIIDDIKAGLNLLPYCPIIVYVDVDVFYIIDGQHRFEVSMRLEEPVYYVESEKLNLRQIARMNSRSDKWTNKNFLDCYVNLGMKDYVVLRDFLKKHHIVYSAAISFLMTGKITSGGTDVMETFRNGEFKVNFLEKAEEVVTLTTSLFEIYAFRTDRNLISAVHEIMNKGLCDWGVLRRKIKSATNEMAKQGSKKEYISTILRECIITIILIVLLYFKS